MGHTQRLRLQCFKNNIRANGPYYAQEGPPEAHSSRTPSENQEFLTVNTTTKHVKYQSLLKREKNSRLKSQKTFP